MAASRYFEKKKNLIGNLIIKCDMSYLTIFGV